MAQNEKRRKLFSHLAENLDFRKIEDVFSKHLGNFHIWLVDPKTADDEKMAQNLCKTAKQGDRNRKACLAVLQGVLRKTDASGKLELFECPFGRWGFCSPLTEKGETFGYIIVCQLRDRPRKEMLALFSYFINTFIRGAEKERELDELQERMRPRAIALSTVHTIHRLITSTLNLNELLLRIARLSMQIIRANRCSIKLIDSKRKTLLPKATVDLRTKKAKLKKVKIGRWAPGKAVKYGKSIRAERYLATPLIDEDVIGVITLYDKIDSTPFSVFDEEIMKTLAEQSAVAIRNAQLYKEQEQLTSGSIKVLAQIIESKCPGLYTPKSVFLKIVRLVGQKFGLRENELKNLQYATLLHDTGELMVPERVLKKKGKLTKREYQMIREHPLQGAKIIKSLKSLKSVAPIIMHHHENFNGTGYPGGLRGNEIPIGARIMAVVTAFEAMVTKRPYRKTVRSLDRAIAEIKKNSGRQFDPKVVDAFLKVLKRKDILNQITRKS